MFFEIRWILDGHGSILSPFCHHFATPQEDWRCLLAVFASQTACPSGIRRESHVAGTWEATETVPRCYETNPTRKEDSRKTLDPANLLILEIPQFQTHHMSWIPGDIQLYPHLSLYIPHIWKMHGNPKLPVKHALPRGSVLPVESQNRKGKNLGPQIDW